MRALARYFAGLDAGRTTLWCYAIWYAVHVAFRFDADPLLWLTSLGLSAVIGTALVLSTRTQGQRMRLPGWVTFRLYLMPFCVSSFAALVKDRGYVLVFAPDLFENLLGVGLIVVFVLLVRGLRIVVGLNPFAPPARLR